MTSPRVLRSFADQVFQPQQRLEPAFTAAQRADRAQQIGQGIADRRLEGMR